MKRELFYIKDLDEFTILDFLIILILIINVFLHIKGFNEMLFSVSVLICFILCMLKIFLYFKETKVDGYINIIRHPIIIDDRDIYIVGDNFNFVNVVSAILIVLFISIIVVSIFVKSLSLNASYEIFSIVSGIITFFKLRPAKTFE